MKKFFISIFVIISFFFFLGGQTAKAECTGQKFGMHIITRDSEGKLIPGINYAVYTEIKNPDGKPYFDDKYKLTSGKTDGGGQSDILCLDITKYPYAVKLWETNPTYGYYSVWSDSMASEGGIFTINKNMSDLFVVIRDAEGTLIKSSVFDVYVQGFDVDGDPIIDETKLNADKLVLSKINTSDVGGKHLYLSEGSYAIKMQATGGKEFFYLWNQKVWDKQITALDYRQGTLRTVIEDGNNSLMKNQKFSVYKQDYDAQNKPIVGNSVALNLQTGSTGSVDAYLPTGEYAIQIPSSISNQFYNIWKIKVGDENLTKIKYRLSGLRVILRDEAGDIVKNGKFNIATQKADALGRPVVDAVLASGLNTGEGGFKDVYLPAGAYAIVYGTNKIYNLDVASTYFTKIDWGKNISGRMSKEAYFSNPFANTNFSLRKTTAPKMSLIGFAKTISGSYKTSASVVKGTYAVTFNYTEDQLKKAKVKAEKIRIAFYSPSTRKWQYVGKNYSSKKTAIVYTKTLGTFVLVAVK